MKTNLEEVREILRSDNYICFTSDLDWAPEAAVQDMIDLFCNNEIKPTVFVTHSSEVIEKNKCSIDIGIHPNFILPSSQGKSKEEIINYCMELASDSKVFRCHRWYSDNDIYDMLKERGFLYESNLCTNLDRAEPFIHRSGLISFPVYLEDGAYIIHKGKTDEDTVSALFKLNGLKVVNIHPMHYALNTPYFSYTREIKDKLARAEWNGMNRSELENLAYKGFGIRSFIDNIVQFAKNEKINIITLKQVYNLIQSED